MNRGKLIVFEGIDGSGKSTQLKRAAEALRVRGLDPIETREPTEGVWGRKIREMAKGEEHVPPQTELDWFFADRREHMECVVRPGLEAGRLILSDRSYISTVAYQGARGLDVSEILKASEAEFVRPDLILLFELSPEEGMKRIEARGGLLERIFEEYSFQQRVAKIFQELDVEGLVRIEAGRNPDAIAKDVESEILRILG